MFMFCLCLELLRCVILEVVHQNKTGQKKGFSIMVASKTERPVREENMSCLFQEPEEFGK